MKTPGERFNYLTTDSKIKPSQLAELLEVSPSAVYKLGSMEVLSTTRRKKMVILEKKYNFNLDWIATGEGEPYLKSRRDKTKQAQEIERIKKEYKLKLELYEEFKKTQRETIEAQKGEIARLKEIVELQNQLLALKKKRNEGN